MGYVVIGVSVFLASLMTLFSGFGLGTILMPVYALFFPLDAAIALTAVVHFLNNVFKLALLWKHADYKVVLRFGLPALFAAAAGAALLFLLKGLPPIFQYDLGGKTYVVAPVKAVVAVVMLVFAVMEAVPRYRNLSVDKGNLIAGGLLSGFFGGLSGHQGALRSAFLVKSGLGKEAYIATGVVIACIVDVTRLFVYGMHMPVVGSGAFNTVMLVSTVAAFAGAFAGRRLMSKVSLPQIRFLVAVMLVTIAVCLGTGLI